MIFAGGGVGEIDPAKKTNQIRNDSALGGPHNNNFGLGKRLSCTKGFRFLSADLPRFATDVEGRLAEWRCTFLSDSDSDSDTSECLIFGAAHDILHLGTGSESGRHFLKNAS